MELNADEALYVGDEIRDIEAANSANVDIAAVSWGLNSRRALSKHDPTWFVTQPASSFLPAFLQLASR